MTDSNTRTWYTAEEILPARKRRFRLADCPAEQRRHPGRKAYLTLPWLRHTALADLAHRARSRGQRARVYRLLRRPAILGLFAWFLLVIFAGGILMLAILLLPFILLGSLAVWAMRGRTSYQNPFHRGYMPLWEDLTVAGFGFREMVTVYLFQSSFVSRGRFVIHYILLPILLAFILSGSFHSLHMLGSFDIFAQQAWGQTIYADTSLWYRAVYFILLLYPCQKAFVANLHLSPFRGADHLGEKIEEVLSARKQFSQGCSKVINYGCGPFAFLFILGMLSIFVVVPMVNFHELILIELLALANVVTLLCWKRLLRRNLLLRYRVMRRTIAKGEKQLFELVQQHAESARPPDAVI